MKLSTYQSQIDSLTSEEQATSQTYESTIGNQCSSARDLLVKMGQTSSTWLDNQVLKINSTDLLEANVAYVKAIGELKSKKHIIRSNLN
jgi:hypothetical protein